MVSADASQGTLAAVPPRGPLPLRQLARLAVAVGWRQFVLMPACNLWTRVQLWCWAATCGRRLRVTGRVRLYVSGRLRIGNDVAINSGAGNFVGVERRMAIWVGRGATAVIGDGCRMSNSTIVATDSVEILPETLIGGGCNIYDTDFHHLHAAGRVEAGHGPAPSAPIRIGPRAFIGGHVTVLKGVTIGEGSIIGACSVVTKSVPPGEIWAGVPARFVRKVDMPATQPAATAAPAVPPAETAGLAAAQSHA
jgi:acetyltransferase-like isoleucine patch superfamily enzyme